MSDKAPEKPAGGASTTDDDSAWKRWSVLLPALTFLVGLALGAAVVGVSSTSDDGVEGPTAQQSAPPLDPSPSPDDLVVTIPAPCVEAAEKAELAFDVLQDAASAVRDLDARRLAEIVDLAQTEQAEVDQLVSACREQAGMQLLEPSGEATPTTQPTPSS